MKQCVQDLMTAQIYVRAKKEDITAGSGNRKKIKNESILVSKKTREATIRQVLELLRFKTVVSLQTAKGGRERYKGGE